MIYFSFIIPHKNIPSLLTRCLASIPRREDIEIIVVDDKSDPSKVSFDEFPGKTDTAVRLIFTKEGKGAGYARNIGMKEARGRWLLFTDADDFYNPGCLEWIDSYKEAKEDIIYFDYNTVYSDTLCETSPRTPTYRRYLLQDDLEGLRYASDTPWPKMIKRRLVEEHALQFDETPVGNDLMFSAKAGHFARSIAICKYPLYCSTIRSDSLWYGMTYENLLIRIEVACRYTRFVEGLKRSRFRIYSYGFVDKCKPFGKKAYLKALWLYLRKEYPYYIAIDFYRLLKAKIKTL